MALPEPFPPTDAVLDGARGLLRSALGRRLAADDLAWLDGEAQAVAGAAPARRLFMSFSAVCRHAPKEPLGLDDDAAARADRLRPGWRPAAWTAEEAARALLVLHLPHRDGDEYGRVLDRLFDCADLAERVALYRALPILPHPRAFVARCAEGVRSNMTDVFRAVAHDNPFPAERLDEAAWNQLVLKALFVEVPLAPVPGLDARANPALARMLLDYAHERWAAGRSVSPELWRCVGPFAEAGALEDLGRVLATGTEEERRAAADALRRCPRPEAAAILGRGAAAGGAR